MKKISIIIFLVLCVGCVKPIRTLPNLPLRDQLHLGMSIDEVWELYGYDKYKPLNTFKKVKYTLIEERDTGKCIFATHRYWLKNTKSFTGNQTYLLTFISCRLPEYEAVQEERKRRRELFENDANLKKEIDALCQEYPIKSEHRDILIEFLYIYINRPLPPDMSDKMLIKIEQSGDIKETDIR
jgi:hypothetical protein